MTSKKNYVRTRAHVTLTSMLSCWYTQLWLLLLVLRCEVKIIYNESETVCYISTFENVFENVFWVNYHVFKMILICMANHTAEDMIKSARLPCKGRIYKSWMFYRLGGIQQEIMTHMPLLVHNVDLPSCAFFRSYH